MIVIGIDEAGLGPMLGPMVTAVVALRVSDSTALTRLWRSLQDHNILVADSKQLLKQNQAEKSLTALQQTVLAFLDNTLSTEKLTLDRDSILTRLSGTKEIAALDELPWYKSQHWQPLQWQDPVKLKETSQLIRELLTANQIVLSGMSVSFLTAKELNQRFNNGDNKHQVALAQVGKLLSRQVYQYPDEDINAIIDRQGGRVRYMPWLWSLFPDFIPQESTENSEISSYSLQRQPGHGKFAVEFIVKGDSQVLAIALASMLAKWIRELCMHDFNLYFSQLQAGIKSTAGYPQDAKRWLGDMQNTLAINNIDISNLVRVR